MTTAPCKCGAPSRHPDFAPGEPPTCWRCADVRDGVERTVSGAPSVVAPTALAVVQAPAAPATAPTLINRRRGLGASELAAAIGLSRWQSPIDVWARKTGRVADETSDAYAEWGTHLEPVLRDWYFRQFDARPVAVVDGRTAYPWPGEPLLWASPDAEADYGDRRVTVELKNNGVRTMGAWGPPGTDAVPPEYLVQAQAQMVCRDTREAHVVASLGGLPPQVWIVDRDDRLCATLAERARGFWRFVESDTPPPARSADDYARLVALLAPRSTKRSMVATAELERLCAELREQERIADAAAELATWTRARIQRRMGDADELVGEFGRVTWRTNKNGTRVFRPTWKSNNNNETSEENAA